MMMQRIIGMMVMLWAACSAMGGESQIWKPRLALQLYTFRSMTFVDAVKTARKLGFEYIEAYPGQKLGEGFNGTSDFSMPVETRAGIKAFLAEQKIKLVNYGVVGASGEEGWKKLFDFAKDMGIEILQVEAGKDPTTLDLLNRLSGETGIKVALHNHTQPTGFPDAMLAQLKDRPNLGAGPDIGHWARAKIPIMDAFHKLDGRITTLHFVDIDQPGRDVAYGTGITDVKGVLNELKRQKFNGVITCEYHQVAKPLEEVIGACVKWYNAYFETP